MTALTVVPIIILSAGSAVVSRGLAPLLSAAVREITPERINQNTNRKEEILININTN